MTPEQLAARWLADCKRYAHNGTYGVMDEMKNGYWLHVDDAIAALARAMGPDDLPPTNFKAAIAFAEQEPGMRVVPYDDYKNLLARIAAQEAQIKGLKEHQKGYREAQRETGVEFSAAINRAEAAEAEASRLRDSLARMEGALRGMPKVVRYTTVCQGPTWPDDRPGVWVAALTACENAVQQAVDAALTESPADGGSNG